MKKIDIYPLKGMFLPSDTIILQVELMNAEGETKVIVEVFDLFERVYSNIQNLDFCCGIAKIEIPSMKENRGYGVSIKIGSLLSTTSFEIYDDWKKIPRYGFLSDFTTKNLNRHEYLKTLLKLHINVVQYYDWMYQHNDLVSNSDEFVDLMGRTLNQKTVKNRIFMLNKHNIRSIAYGAIYGASNEFYKNHKDWAFYNNRCEPIQFIDVFTIMNFTRNSPWHNYIINEFKTAIEKMGFDGIHMDTYGYPKIARDFNGNVIHLSEHFNELINDTKRTLEENNLSNDLIFNNVGSWPVEVTYKAKQSALYIEVWDPISKYNDLVHLVRRVKSLTKQKQLIISAYLKPYYEFDKMESTISHKLLSAVLYSEGAHHLIMGEEQKVLRTGYYCDYGTLSDEQFNEIRKYFDFNSRYSTLLYDEHLEDKTLTHTKGDNEEYVFPNEIVSVTPESGKIFVSIKETKKRKIIHFINLIGQTETVWNELKNLPIKATNIEVNVLVLQDVIGVYIASPDNNNDMVSLKYKMFESPNGSVIKFIIKSVEIWSMVLIQLK